MAALQIYDPRERLLVAAADRALSPCRAVRSLWRRTSPRPPAAAHPAAAARAHRRPADGRCRRSPTLRELAPEPRSISSSAAGTCRSPGPSRAVDARRDARRRAGWREGDPGSALPRCCGARRRWRRPALRPRDQLRAGHPQQPAPRGRAARAFTAGYASGGGGALLDRALDYDPRAHTTDNARRLVAAVVRPPPDAGRSGGAADASRVAPRARPPRRAAAASPAAHCVGVHVSGGRAIKQWPADALRRGRAPAGATRTARRSC